MIGVIKDFHRCIHFKVSWFVIIFAAFMVEIPDVGVEVILVILELLFGLILIWVKWVIL